MFASPRSAPAAAAWYTKSPGRFDVHRHVSDHELQTLELGQLLPELPAFLPHIPTATLERTLGDAHGLRTYRPGLVWSSVAMARGESGSRLADHSDSGNPAILEMDPLPGRRPPDPQFPFLGPQHKSGIVGMPTTNAEIPLRLLPRGR